MVRSTSSVVYFDVHHSRCSDGQTGGHSALTSPSCIQIFWWRLASTGQLAVVIAAAGNRWKARTIQIDVDSTVIDMLSHESISVGVFTVLRIFINSGVERLKKV